MDGLRHFSCCPWIVLAFSILAGVPASRGDHYCGIYAMCAAARALGVAADPRELLEPEYVSSHRGSTAEDLIRAGEVLGLRVTAWRNLGIASLRDAREPLILHCNSYGQLVQWDHWVTFLGFREGRMVIFGYGHQPMELDPCEVLMRWDGMALAVHRDAERKAGFARAESRGYVAWLALLAGVLAVAGFLRVLGVPAGVGFALLTVTGLLVSQVLDPYSLLRNREPLEHCLILHGPRAMPEVTTEELERLVSRPDPADRWLLVDARYADALQWGTIPGAINLPVDMGWSELRKATAGIDRQTMVVVFCQSAGCSFDRAVGQRLRAEGFTDVHCYSPGYAGWKDRNTRSGAFPPSVPTDDLPTGGN